MLRIECVYVQLGRLCVCVECVEGQVCVCVCVCVIES